MRRYELDEPGVVSETIDDEAVVINLERGVYFSIRGVGLAVWTDLIARVPLESVIAVWQERFPAEAGRIDAEFATFAAELETEGLLRLYEADASTGSAAGPDASLAAFETPSIQKYTDMEALLLLDPIHDTDEQGWPHRP